MGEVYRPKDIINRRGRKISDLTPQSGSKPIKPNSLGALVQELESMKMEIRKIKEALKAHGITVK